MCLIESGCVCGGGGGGVMADTGNLKSRILVIFSCLDQELMCNRIELKVALFLKITIVYILWREAVSLVPILKC